MASELAMSVSVETAHLTLLGKHLALAERELAAARAMLAELGAPAVRITQLPGCGDGTAPVTGTADAAGASAAAKRDVSAAVRAETPAPPAPPQAGGPDWAAFALAIGEGCTVAFAQANAASMGTHAGSSGMPCGRCVTTMRMKWLAAQKRAGIAPAPPAAAPVPDAAPLSAALKARAREYVTQLGMTPQEAIATAKADLASEAAARGEPTTAPATPAAKAPAAAPDATPAAPAAAAPAATERPVPTLTALDAEMADVLTESKRQWMRDVVAARLQGLADPALPPTDWASEKNAVKLLRRIAKAARVA